MIRSAISLALALSVVGTSGPARAELIAYEGFDYDDVGEDVQGKEEGIGFEIGWRGARQYDVADGSLSFRGLQTEGNHAIMGEPIKFDSWFSLNRRLDNEVSAADVQTRYLSFLMRPEGRVGQGGAAGFFGVSLNDGRVYIGKTTTPSYGFGTFGQFSTNASDLRAVSGETVLFVVRADLMPGNDVFTLYLNPIRGHEPTNGTVKDDIDIGTLRSIDLNAAGAFSVDEIRWGDSFEDVTPGPKHLVTELIAAGEPWSLFPGSSEPSPFPQLAWTTPQFDDHSWETADEGFGYGSSAERRQVVTALDEMKGNYNSVYLRHSFQVDDPAAVSDVVLELDYDDGFIAYINGIEVTRFATGTAGTPEPHDATASRQRLPMGPSRFFVDLSEFPDLLRAGDDNVLAIQGINRRAFDLDFVLSQISLSGLIPEVTMLQAGDADEDLDFDQLDLVQVQIAGKYLTGQAATWGDGDWNGAPGGQQGSPPAGDGLFNQHDIIAAQQAAAYLTGPYAALAPGGQTGDGQTSLVYNPGTGELAVDAPAGVELTSINIDSAAGIFTGQSAQNLGGSFDNDADNNIFKATFGSSFGSLSFGNVAQPGLSQEFVLSDLTVVGSLAGGGDLGPVDLIYVPEPAAMVLAIVGLVSLMAGRRLVNPG